MYQIPAVYSIDSQKKMSFIFKPMHSSEKFQYLQQRDDVLHKNPVQNLKGQWHEIFDFWFFSWISFPQAPEYTIRAVSNFFENSRRYSQFNVHYRCRWHRWQLKFAAVVIDTNYNLPPASLTPAANMLPVSLTPVANLPIVSTTQAELVEKFAASVVDTGGAPWPANISAKFWKRLKWP